MATQQTQHTPGPWSAVPHGYEFRIVYNDAGNWLAEVFDYDADGEADARLIAAAPDLLEALEGLTSIVEAMRHTTSLGRNQMARLEKARAAIAKAKGDAA